MAHFEMEASQVMSTGDDKMSAIRSVVNKRWRRYADWIDGELSFQSYPAGCQSPADLRLAVRFLSALGAAALLLPDAQTRRLNSLVSHLLKTDQEILPSALAPELAQLKHSDFNWFVTGQFVMVLGCGNTVEEMSEHWFGDLPLQPFQGLLIDGELNVEQMQRLNDIPLIRVTSTCAGHPEHADDAHPYFSFVVRRSAVRRQDIAFEVAAYMGSDDTETFASGKSVQVQSRLVNDGTNRDLMHEWWQRAIARLAMKMDTYANLDRLATAMESVGGIAESGNAVRVSLKGMTR
jgi:hypothetical protein